MGMTMTFGLMGVTVGALNAVSGATAALLIGLGIDFVIVSYGRYVEERSNGRSVADALMIMNGQTGRSVISGAVTTTATFWAFAGTAFVGLRQMGFLTGTGILFCLVSVLFLMPAMLAWSEAHHSKRRREPRLYLHGFGTDRLIRFSMRHARAVLAVGAVLTIVLGAIATRIKFEDSIRGDAPARHPQHEHRAPDDRALRHRSRLHDAGAARRLARGGARAHRHRHREGARDGRRPRAGPRREHRLGAAAARAPARDHRLARAQSRRHRLGRARAPRLLRGGGARGAAPRGVRARPRSVRAGGLGRASDLARRPAGRRRQPAPARAVRAADAAGLDLDRLPLPAAAALEARSAARAAPARRGARAPARSSPASTW